MYSLFTFRARLMLELPHQSIDFRQPISGTLS